jgi:hypothetical protein
MHAQEKNIHTNNYSTYTETQNYTYIHILLQSKNFYSVALAQLYIIQRDMHIQFHSNLPSVVLLRVVIQYIAGAARQKIEQAAEKERAIAP